MQGGAQSAQWNIAFFGITSKKQSRMFFYMEGTSEDNNRPNRAIMVISTNMRNVISSAAEA